MSSGSVGWEGGKAYFINTFPRPGEGSFAVVGKIKGRLFSNWSIGEGDGQREAKQLVQSPSYHQPNVTVCYSFNEPKRSGVDREVISTHGERLQ